jgi:hypothetical protein
MALLRSTRFHHDSPCTFGTCAVNPPHGNLCTAGLSVVPGYKGVDTTSGSLFIWVKGPPLPVATIVNGTDECNGEGYNRGQTATSSVFVRDTVPPVAVARLTNPDVLFFVPAAGLFVTNSTLISVTLSTPDEDAQQFIVAVSRLSSAQTAVYVFNVTEGTVGVSAPWDGALALAVVRVGFLLPLYFHPPAV